MLYLVEGPVLQSIVEFLDAQVSVEASELAASLRTGAQEAPEIYYEEEEVEAAGGG